MSTRELSGQSEEWSWSLQTKQTLGLCCDLRAVQSSGLAESEPVCLTPVRPLVTHLPFKVHIRDNLRTLTGSAGQCTHNKPVDVHIDPFCTVTVSYIYTILSSSGSQKNNRT
jgi:hypothetical protein